MATSMFLSIICFMGLAILYLRDIQRAVEKSAEIAEREEAARIQHRAKTVEDRAEEKRERQFSAVKQAMRSVVKEVKGFKLKLLNSHITSHSDRTYSASFLYEVEDLGNVVLGFSSWPKDKLSVSVRRDRDNDDQKAGEMKLYRFPDEIDDAVEYIVHRLNHL